MARETAAENTGGVRRIFKKSPKTERRKIERELSQGKTRIQKTLVLVVHQKHDTQGYNVTWQRHPDSTFIQKRRESKGKKKDNTIGCKQGKHAW